MTAQLIQSIELARAVDASQAIRFLTGFPGDQP